MSDDSRRIKFLPRDSVVCITPENRTGVRDVCVQVAIDPMDEQIHYKESTQGLFKVLSQKSDLFDTQASEVDPLVRIFGHFGLWHFLVQLLLFLCNVPYVFQLLVGEYESKLSGDYWCARPSHLSTLPIDKWKEISQIFETAKGNRIFDPCHLRNINYSSLELNDPSTWVITGNYSVLVCKEWEYEETQSILSQFDLACLSDSALWWFELGYASGGIFGSFLCGYLIDRMGRRNFIIKTLILNGLISFLTALSPYFVVYVFFRTLQGFFTIGFYPSLTVLSIEITGYKWAGIIGSMFMFSFPVGYVFCAILSYNLKNWRQIHYCATVLSMFLLSGWWLIPESPRWLWLNKESGKLHKMIEDVSIINGHSLISHKLLNLLMRTTPDQDMTVDFSSLIKTPIIRKRTFVSCVLSLCFYYTYYGNILALTFKEIYSSALYSATLEFTATAVCLGTVGRKWLNDSLVLFSSCILCGFLCLFVNALEKDAVEVVYCIIGIRFFASVVNTGLMTYIAKLYPTQMRGLGLGICQFFNFGALLLVGFTRNNLEGLKQGISVFLMGMAGVFSAFLVLLLPLPRRQDEILDTIDEAECYHEHIIIKSI